MKIKFFKLRSSLYVKKRKRNKIKEKTTTKGNKTNNKSYRKKHCKIKKRKRLQLKATLYKQFSSNQLLLLIFHCIQEWFHIVPQQNKFASSTNKIIFRVLESSQILFICNGPKTQPCVTPHPTCSSDDLVSFIYTYRCLFSEQLFIQESAKSLILYACN